VPAEAGGPRRRGVDDHDKVLVGMTGSRRRSVVLQLRDELERLITDEGLMPGDQMPTEAEVGARFGVARGSVREAFKLLEQSGLIEVEHGRGRFVSAIGDLTVDRPITEFESVTDMLAAIGYRPVNKVMSVELAEPSDEETAALQLAPGVAVVRVKRLRMRGRQPLIYEINAFPASLAEGESLNKSMFSGSLNDWLREHGHPLVSSAAEIKAATLPADAARLVPTDAGVPWLLIAERCVDHGGAPVLYSQDYHRGDIFSFHVLRRRTT